MVAFILSLASIVFGDAFKMKRAQGRAEMRCCDAGWNDDCYIGMGSGVSFLGGGV